MKRVFAAASALISVKTAMAFLWASGVVGFFAGVADVVQYFRYSSGFPESDFTMNLLAGIAAFLMFSFSLAAITATRRKHKQKFTWFMVASSAMAFVLAFLPRPGIGSAVRPDLFIYMGGVGILALFLVSISDPPDTPDNSP